MTTVPAKCLRWFARVSWWSLRGRALWRAGRRINEDTANKNTWGNPFDGFGVVLLVLLVVLLALAGFMLWVATGIGDS